MGNYKDGLDPIKKMRIKLICTDCKKEFTCEQGKELRTDCPRCGSGNVTIPLAIDNPEYIASLQKKLR